MYVFFFLPKDRIDICIHIRLFLHSRAQRVRKVLNSGLRSFFSHQPPVRNAYARRAHSRLPYSPLHDRETASNTRNCRSASPHVHPLERLLNALYRHQTHLQRTTSRSDRMTHRTRPADRPKVHTLRSTYPLNAQTSFQSRGFRADGIAGLRTDEADEAARGTAPRPIRTASRGDPGG